MNSFTINGVDFTHLTHTENYKVGYEWRDGRNSGQTLDGTDIKDHVALKAIISIDLEASTAAQRSQLLSTLADNLDQPLSVRYFDPLTDDLRTSLFNVDIPNTSIIWISQANYSDKSSIILVER